ncbi:MAG: hypothetical protein RRY19_00185 [Clostridium sp.]
MRNRILDISIFIFSIICLIISARLMYSMGIYVDEYGTNPSVICGGDFWLYTDWVRLGFSVLISVLSGINLFRKNK